MKTGTKCIVTGAAGFLGYHLATQLLSEGQEVLGIDNLQTGSLRNLSELKQNSRFKFLEQDVINLAPNSNDTAQILKWFKLDSKRPPIKIYHLACPASPPLYQKNPLHTLDTCYLGTRNLLEIAKESGARILLASTSETYGDPEVHPQPETYRGNVNTQGPRSCYDEGKRVMETLGHIFVTEANLEVRTARIFNTYGPRMNPADGRVLTNFITQGLRGEALTIFGDGSQTRSLCYVSDLIRGIELLMKSSTILPINLGSQFEMSVLDLAIAVRTVLNLDLKFEFFPLPQDDPKVRRPDISRAKELLNWEPTIEPTTGIRSMIQDLKGL